MVMRPLFILLLSFLCFNFSLDAQTIVKGIVRDGETGEDIIGANIIIQGLTEGTISDWDGTFEFTTDKSYPITLEVSYIGYAEQVIELTDNTPLDIKLEESTAVIQEIVVKGQSCLLYTSPSPRDATLSRMPSSA